MSTDKDGTDQHGRKLFWWRLPVSPDESEVVGRSMLRTIIIWLTVVLALVALLALILTLS